MSTKNRKNSAPGSISTSLALKSATDMVDQELFLALQERERRSELYDHRSSTVSDPVKAGQYARLAEIFATYAKNARDEIARRGLRSGLIIRKDGANLDCCSACGEPSPSFVVALGIGPATTVRLCPECAAHLSSTLDRLGSGLDR